MRYVRRSGGVGRRTHTGFVGVKAALNAPHHAGACKAAEDCLKVKCRDEYVLENQRQVRDVHDDYYERYDYVNKAHDRNENAGYIGKALAAAEDAQCKQNGKYCADNDRSLARVIEAEGLKGVLSVEGRKHIVAHNIGQDKDNCENDAEPALFERILHVVGRAAVISTVGVLVLIDLSQGRLDERGCSAEDSGYPHPEDSSESAEADSR